MRNKSCMAISIHPEKDFEQVQHPLMMKNSLESDCNLPQHNKGAIYDKPTANIILNGEKLFPLRQGARQDKDVHPCQLY